VTVNPLTVYPETKILGLVNSPCQANDDELDELALDSELDELESIDDELFEDSELEEESIELEELESIDELDVES